MKTPHYRQPEESPGLRLCLCSISKCKELLLSLPKEKGWRTPFLYQFQGFWCQPKEIQSIISFQKHFKSRKSDVILATIPKSGTTWLKALVFAIINRRRFPPATTSDTSRNHPLLTSNPHDLVPFLEYKLYGNNQVPGLSNFPDDDQEPRTFATHVPYPSLEESIKKSENVKIVYLCRNPFDTSISSWHFIKKLRPESLPQFSLEEAFKMYCNGIVGFGPFWEHMLGYWNESLKRPDVEEREGVVIQEIAKLCSFDKLKELEVNKYGKAMTFSKHFENKHLFRKGEVGDWVNYLNPSMVKQLAQLMEEKIMGSGLLFKLL
ncbi:hypothetical protein JRO89_XS14G0131000 [Xanthoceras sorbifolium]|uniref:Sulfotransferase n=1 Tax=Xanthoceras sorbifolium TaxID=99658 RepID=A0ABQ8H571_9ROSI|nr:hypothetical protein JRO89_XS14G0131000 [Xanthoceras sorbifolium]